jgi:hypothetical protein
MTNLPPIRLTRNKDRSVTGILPDGYVIHWGSYLRNLPTRRNAKVMVNQSWWQPVWSNAQ